MTPPVQKTWSLADKSSVSSLLLQSCEEAGFLSNPFVVSPNTLDTPFSGWALKRWGRPKLSSEELPDDQNPGLQKPDRHPSLLLLSGVV